MRIVEITDRYCPYIKVLLVIILAFVLKFQQHFVSETLIGITALAGWLLLCRLIVRKRRLLNSQRTFLTSTILFFLLLVILTFTYIYQEYRISID